MRLHLFALLAATDVPRVPVGEAINWFVEWLKDNLAVVFGGIGAFLTWVNDGLTQFLETPMIVVLALIFGFLVWWIKDWRYGAGAFLAAGALAYVAAFVGFPPALVLVATFTLVALLLRGWRFGLFTLIAFLLVDSMDQWAGAMDTLALVLISSVIALAVSIPLGIAAARVDTVSRIVKPGLDFMQTMPAFIYLLPAIALFHVGPVPGVVATVVFSMPPGVRLAELGIRQVDQEVVEAGEAFGASPGAILGRIQIPLAMPTVMAGVNQVIMLALSMVVIAGLAGAGGLGNAVYTALSTLNLGGGFEAGLAVVILAIYLDRLTVALTNRSAVVRAQQIAGAQ